MSGAGIRVAGLHQAYGAKQVLRGLDLEVPFGTTTAVLGANGAGKTTLLRVLAQLVPAQTTEFHVARSASGALGFLPAEIPAFEPRWSIARYLRFFGKLTRDDRSRARTGALVRALHLEDHLDTRLGAASSGTRRKAEIARCFLSPSPVFLLDEPTRELDLVTRSAARKLFRDAAAAGAAVVVATHDLLEAENVADDVVILQEGRFAWRGPSPAARGAAMKIVATIEDARDVQINALS